jgi:quinol monooxygenase YgiN
MFTIKEITSFEIPEGLDDEFLKGWNVIAEQMRHNWGAHAIQLHASLDPQAKFRFVAVAEWESLIHYQAAQKHITQAFENLRRKMPFAAYPATYRMVLATASAPHANEMFPR